MPEIEPAIVADPADVTPGWMTSVLRAAGHEVTVSALSREAVGTGQMAHNERFFLTYTGERGDAPATVVGKFPSPNPDSRAAGAAGAYRSEVRFYTDLAPGLSVRVPACLHGAVRDDSTLFTLILEDLAPAAQGDQIAGADDAQIEAAVVNLAGLHGPRFGDPTLADIDWMVFGMEAQAVAFVEAVAPLFVERFRDRLTTGAVRVVETFAERAAGWLAAKPSPPTVVHGDYRLDNLLFATKEGGVPVAAVDWQTVSIGPGGRDVAYLLGTSAEPAARRSHEAHMLETYRKALERFGVTRSAADVEADYRLGAFQGPFITMLGSMAVGKTARGDAMFVAMAERSAALILDHDALDLIA